jgi:hypothetical protein
MPRTPVPTATTAGTLRLDYVDIDAIEFAERNPKGHDIGALHSSFERFGFVTPPLINEGTGRLVAGHGRIETLRQRRARNMTPPAHVHVQPDGRWLAPVLRGITFASDMEAEAYLLADNQHTLLGGWQDHTVLAEMLQSLAQQDALLGTGFDADDLDELLTRLGNVNPFDDLAGGDTAQVGGHFEVAVSVDTPEARDHVLGLLIAAGYAPVSKVVRAS